MVVLAGGQSRRFGADKLEASVDGRPLLDRALVGLPDDAVVIVVGPERPVQRPVRFVREQPAGGGPAAALVAGLTEALTTGAERIAVLPGDAPAAGRTAALLLGALDAAAGATALVATDATGFEQPLQLALLTGAAAALVEAAGPDRAAGGSARALVNKLSPPAVRYPLPAEGHWDIDTPEQLRAWSARDSPAVTRILAAVESLGASGGAVAVALDGPSGAGKSLLARALALHGRSTVIEGDHFSNPALASLTSAQRSVISGHEVAELAIDWRRLRAEALQPLLQGERVRYRPFDWTADDGRPGRTVDLAPADLVIVDGVYSARAELSDLMDLMVYVEVAEPVRHQRLQERADNSGSMLRQRGEAYYFSRLRPPDSFPLRVPGA